MTKTLDELMSIAQAWALEKVSRDDLESALRELIADAERYRWLRANTGDQIPYRGWWQIAGGAGAYPSKLDAAIDSQRTKASE